MDVANLVHGCGKKKPVGFSEPHLLDGNSTLKTTPRYHIIAYILSPNIVTMDFLAVNKGLPYYNKFYANFPTFSHTRI